MATTAEAYGFGARAPYATPRASDWEMKERVRLSGLFPRVRNEPLSKQLQALLKEFEQNAALTGILERRRRLEERLRHELRGTEGMDALNRSVAPPWLASAGAAKASADFDAAYRADRAPTAAPVRELIGMTICVLPIKLLPRRLLPVRLLPMWLLPMRLLPSSLLTNVQQKRTGGDSG